ncbi:MAG: PPC domain-containing protein [Chloroflexi bacterium]|nr:PPC domain-containing protein [Chloroflexota bacterium]
MKTRLVRVVVILLLAFSGSLPTFAMPHRQAPPEPIAYGDSVTGAISEIQTEARYVIEATQGDRLVALVSTTTGDLDPFLNLTSVEGTLLASDDNSGGGTTAQITFVVPASAAYLIVVTRSPEEAGNTTGDFQLTVTNAAAIVPTESSTPPVENTTPPATTESSNTRLQALQSGTPTQGRVDTNSTFNLYWFEGTAGQEISLAPDTTSSLLPLLVLYQADFSEILRAQPGETLSATLTDDGVYFVAAAQVQPGSSGNYAFTFDNGTGNAGPTVDPDFLLYGQNIGGSVTNTNPTSRFRFRAEAGDAVTINMNAISGDLDSYLLLVDSSGNTVAEDDNSGGNGDAQISSTIATSGEFFIITTRLGQAQGVTTGEFLLALISDAPPRLPEATPPTLPTEYAEFPRISYGETLQGEVSNAVFLTVYVFEGRAGDNVNIVMQATSGNLDSYMVLLDDARIPLLDADDISEANKNAQLQFTLPQDAFYAIVATRFDQGEGTTEGSFDLSLDLSSNEQAVGSPILDKLVTERLAAGDTPSGTFEPLRFASLYSFTAVENSLIDFAVTADGGEVGTLILTDAFLNPISISNNGVLLAIPAPVSGDYLVIVAPQAGPAANISGGFFVALNAGAGQTDNPDDGNTETGGTSPAVAIAYGTTVRGRITEDVTAEQYVFQGRGGDIVDISMTSNGPDALDCLLQLLNANGDVIGENDDIDPGVVRDSLLTATLPSDGQYTIIATHFEDPTGQVEQTFGNYTLTLAYRDPTTAGVDREARAITFGQSLSDSIDTDTYLYFYYFEGTQGDTVTITVDTTEGNLDSIMYLYTYDSANQPRLLTANDDSPLGGTYDPYIEYRLPRTGTYLIAVTRFAETAATPTSGTYTITLQNAGAASDSQ